MASHFRVVVSGEYYGVCNTRQEADKIIQMHRTVLSGRTETKASILDYKVEQVEGDYPSKTPMKFSVPYKTNTRIPAVGELK